MNYESALEYLQNLTKFGFNFGLGRIEELMRRLGNPQDSLRIIHIGGTNGKGSTSAILSSILRAAGYRCGVFSSPHLHRYTERYRINGIEITEEKIAALITEVKPHLDAMVTSGYEHPTEFEVSTALAFLYFARENVDYLVLEVGLGGAIDSTNIITPLVSVITNVGMDHMDYLGNTLGEIATVKAGIIKSGIPLVTGVEQPEALAQVLAKAQQEAAPVKLINQDFCGKGVSQENHGQTLNYTSWRGKYEGLFLTLLGSHQVTNCALALAVIDVLEECGYLEVSEQVLKVGLDQVKWPGRLEIMSQDPLVLIDGAHNYEGALALKEALEQLFPTKRKIFILGMLGDKERERVVRLLAPLADKVYVTKPNSPRATDWATMGEMLEKIGIKVEVEEIIFKAIEKALSEIPEDSMVVITGSLYMIAEARAYWTQEATC